MRDLVHKYLSLWNAFFRNSLTLDMEFKANFLGGLFVDIVYYGSKFFFFSVIYSYVDALGVFTKEDVMIFLIIAFISDTVYMFFFSGNIMHLNRLMINGELDYYLLKPINSQFMVSFRKVKSYAIISILILIILLFNQLQEYSNHISLVNYIIFLLSFFMGIILWYSIEFIISTSCFWYKNFSVAGWLSHEFFKFSLRPDSIYTGLMRKVLFSLIPMTLIASVPTRHLLYGPNIGYFTWQLFISITFFYIARIIWKKGLKLYESASS
jgi:ABC-2 type transport system permease protein